MKLDKIQFAQVVGYIQRQYAISMTGQELRDLDDIITVEIDPQNIYNATPADIDRLMHLMSAGNEKIEAIKLHRKLTGFGLKESKDAVEKYWMSKPVKAAALGDILGSAINKS